MENHHDRKRKILVSDRGGEFLNQKFENLSNECGFVHIFSPPETPEHNGYSKRANHTVMEKACCLMNHSSLPNQYWAEAVNTAIFLSNLSPTLSRENKSPHLLWTNTSTKLTKLQTFGCQDVIHSLKRQQDWKLAPPCQREDATNEDPADSSSALNSPLPNNSPSNHKEPSDQQQSGDNHSIP
ncbi:hypothetical protein O181_108128 [Austropuccinia psidii MF-1]|uniref:Integrase catalytic domain-containing protein n=1 Tax=Austropuccinia psidii MF-1 TaxID=1389203 RepID=A0A9Q3PNJ6_9BASI|nr:hypothetical protein [Austropuccinia psidii MF-1]